MTYELETFADEIERIASDVASMPILNFMEDLKSSMMMKGIPPTIADGVLQRMTIDLSSYDSKDENWKRIIKSFTSIVVTVRAVYGDAILIAVAKTFSIHY